MIFIRVFLVFLLLFCGNLGKEWILKEAKKVLLICGIRISQHGLGTVAHTCNPSTVGGWEGWITRSGDRDHPGQHSETPSQLKIQKISQAWWRFDLSYSGVWGRRITWTQEAEVTASWDRATALQPGWQRNTASQKKTKQNKTKKQRNCELCKLKRKDYLKLP